MLAVKRYRENVLDSFPQNADSVIAEEIGVFSVMTTKINQSRIGCRFL